MLTMSKKLANTRPDLSKLWHPSMNGCLTPNDFLATSDANVWWKCNKNHVFQKKIRYMNRTNKTGCPFCDGEIATEENNFEILYPEIAKEYDLEKNDILPNSFLPNSSKKFWWKCEHGHKWSARVNQRTSGSKCPFCLGLLATKENSLLTKSPELMKLWDYEKNIIDPASLLPSSYEEVFFKCSFGHEFTAKVRNQHRRNGCPECKKNEKVKNSLTKINPDFMQFWDYEKNNEINLDPSKLSIYSNKKAHFLCDKNHQYTGIIASCLRGFSCPYCEGKEATKTNNFAISHPELLKEWDFEENKILDLDPYQILANSSKKAAFICSKGHKWKTEIRLRTKYGSGCHVCTSQKVSDDTNFAVIHPKLAEEWHPTKNGTLKPTDLLPMSNKKIWFKCKAKGHDFEMQLRSRSVGNNCPYCSGKRVCEDNCLAINYPELMSEWDFELNKNLNPYQLLPGSNIKANFICSKGHKWEAKIQNRTLRKQGCPFCSGRRVSEENSVAGKTPHLIKEWHKTKNEPLTAYNTAYQSEKKVWWTCEHGHDFMAKVKYRTKDISTCPECKKK